MPTEYILRQARGNALPTTELLGDGYSNPCSTVASSSSSCRHPTAVAVSGVPSIALTPPYLKFVGLRNESDERPESSSVRTELGLHSESGTQIVITGIAGTPSVAFLHYPVP